MWPHRLVKIRGRGEGGRKKYKPATKKVKRPLPRCNPDAKTIFSKLINHNKCTKRAKGSNYAVKVSGKELNTFLHPTFCTVVDCHGSSCKKNHSHLKRNTSFVTTFKEPCPIHFLKSIITILPIFVLILRILANPKVSLLILLQHPNPLKSLTFQERIDYFSGIEFL